jgi:hypothetical protein
MLAHSQQPLTYVRMHAGIHEGNAPVVDIAGVKLNLAPTLGQGEIVGHAFVVIQKVIADEVTAIAKAQDEVLMAMVRVEAHEMPNDGPNSDVDQRLRYRVRMLAQARAKTTAKQDYFHDSPLS